MKSKKKIALIVIIALAIIMLFPMPIRLKDGGSVEYKALLYTITDVKRLNPAMEEENGNGKLYIEGITIEILGMEVYNNVK